MSSGAPNRFNGILVFNDAAACSSKSSGIKMVPGATALTVTYGANAFANPLVKVITPALETV